MIEYITAVQECAQVAVPEASAKALQYYHSGNVLWIVQQFWSLALPLLLLFGGLSARLQTIAKRWSRGWYFSIVIYLLLLIVVYQLLSLPLDFYAGYLREHQFGLSTQSLGRWIGNYGKGILVTVISAAAFVWIFYLLIKKSPKRWWFYGSLVSIGIMFISMLVQPIWIDPLFNKFGPMKNKELEQKILNLADRAGIEGGRVYEVDKSQDTTALNAYVIGFGKTKRIVLWDTTIARMSTDQILFVMGHEMGHYVLHHIWWYMAFFSVFSFIFFYVLYLSAHFLLRKYHHQFGFKHLHDIASAPLFLFLMSFLMLLAAPLFNAVSRHIEHEADRFGLEITQNNQAAAEAFIALQEQNLAIPRPGVMHMLWLGSHPSLGDRIDFCNEYCPWNQDKPLKYGKYFKFE